jgi:hypothetical protein
VFRDYIGVVNLGEGAKFGQGRGLLSASGCRGDGAAGTVTASGVGGFEQVSHALLASIWQVGWTQTEGLLNGTGNDFLPVGEVVQVNFGFGGVPVPVDLVWGNPQVGETDGVSVAGQGSPKAFEDGLLEFGGAHYASVDGYFHPVETPPVAPVGQAEH